MSDPNECGRYEPEDFTALADALLPRGPVTDDLGPLWAHVADCLPCFARLEEERTWGEHLQKAARQAVAEARLIVAVSLASARWQVEVRKRAAWMRDEPRVGAAPARSRASGPGPTLVEFADFALEIAPAENAVTVTVLSRVPAYRVVKVQALDDDERLLAEAVPGENGSVTLALPALTSYHLAFQWPERGRDAPFVSINSI